MGKASTGLYSDSEAAEEIWHILNFHWGGHTMIFTGTFIATYVTGECLITGCAVLLFAADGIINLATALTHLRQHICRYAVALGMYILFAACLVAGWWASYAMGNLLFTALSMLAYMVNPLLLHLADSIREKQRKQ